MKSIMESSLRCRAAISIRPRTKRASPMKGKEEKEKKLARKHVLKKVRLKGGKRKKQRQRGHICGQL